MKLPKSRTHSRVQQVTLVSFNYDVVLELVFSQVTRERQRQCVALRLAQEDDVCSVLLSLFDRRGNLSVDISLEEQANGDNFVDLVALIDDRLDLQRAHGDWRNRRKVIINNSQVGGTVNRALEFAP